MVSNGELSTSDADGLRVGAEVLAEDGFGLLLGKRVGAILNPASTVHGRPLLDVLAEAGEVELVAAFGPEHGVRGDAPAGVLVADAVDPVTGVPLFSLYGESKEPTAEALADLDVLVFDLQGVGSRFYTFISTMGLAMQAAARAGVEFVVLDRPNPLGRGVEGFVRDDEHESFVSLYPIPAVYGLTIGELASAIKGEGWVDGLDDLDLTIVAMEAWNGEPWPSGGREWAPPSPGMPSAETVAVYPGMALFEAAAVSIGRGTAEPFELVGAPWADGGRLADELNQLGLAGVRFEETSFVPQADPANPEPPFDGETVRGFRVIVENPTLVRPVALGVHSLSAFYSHARDQGIDGFIAEPGLLDLLAGTDRLRLALDAGTNPDAIIAAWSDEAATFDALRADYFLYRP